MVAREGHTRDRGPRVRRSAFTIVDVLVSMAVIAVLVSILLPSLSAVTETARRVACQSNVRQIGLGLVMYADQHGGELPYSVLLQLGPNRSNDKPEDMLTIRLVSGLYNPASRPMWDGMGLLYSEGYLPAGKIFYCPSHRGENPYARYAPEWDVLTSEVVANYHFRGAGPIGGWGQQAAPPLERPVTRNLFRIDPAQSSLLADGMRVRSDINHKVGANFFRADLTVQWFPDPNGRLAAHLPEHKDDASAGLVLDLWSWFDQAVIGGEE